MGRFDALLSKVSIVDVVSKDFDLKDSGGRYCKGVKHDSLVVDKETQKFYWNSIELSGNALDWLVQVKGQPLEEAVLYLKKISNYRDKPEPQEQSPDYTPNIYQPLLNLFWNLGKSHREYWYRRGYSDETIDKFKLGFTGRCYVIPIVYDGVLYNFQCRTPEKQIWSWTSGLGVLPFNFDVLKTTKSVIITESPVNAIALSQMGFPAVSQNAGAGAWMSAWNRYFFDINEIVFAYDNDLSGFLGARRVARHFKDRARILIWPENFKETYDANDFLKEGGNYKTFSEMLVNNTYPYEFTMSERFLASMRERKVNNDQ